MRNGIITVFVLAAATLAVLTAQSSRSSEVQFKAAEEKERVQGDVKGAIKEYEKIVSGKDRGLAAQALLRIAECHTKLGDAEARKVYERVVREFGDQKDAVAAANERLSGIGKPAVAAGPANRVVLSLAGEATINAVATSPDGRYLLQTYGAEGLILRDLGTGQTRSLSKGPTVGARFSPDGRRIVLMRWIDKTNEAWIVAPDGRGLKKLWQGEKGKWSFLNSWFPDNKRFLVEISLDGQNHRLTAVSATDGTTGNLWEGARPGSYDLMSPDGKYVVFSQRVSRDPVRDELRVLSLTDKSETVLLSDFGLAVNANWTPNGRGLVFLSDRRNPGKARDLWYLAVANGKAQGRPELVKSDFGDSLILAPMTQNGGLYYALRTDMHEILGVQIDPATGKATGDPVTISGAGQASQGIYSPDGQWLAYIRLSSTGTSVHVFRNVATGEEKNVNSGFAIAAGIEQRWFPDGQSLLVNGVHARDPRGLYRLNVQTGAATLVKAGRFGALFAISPDGKIVYYSQRLANETQTRVMAWEMETGKERELLRGDGLGPNRWIPMDLSPDGKQLATARIDGPQHILEVQPVEEGGRREVYRVRDPEVIHDLLWNPDGRYLTFTMDTQEQTSLWRIPVTGGAPQQMGITRRAMGKISLTPDGRRIAFVANNSVSQVMSLENFLPKMSH